MVCCAEIRVRLVSPLPGAASELLAWTPAAESAGEFTSRGKRCKTPHCGSAMRSIGRLLMERCHACIERDGDHGRTSVTLATGLQNLDRVTLAHLM
eukprot:s227_g29.t2